jgi:hypothetical protein
MPLLLFWALEGALSTDLQLKLSPVVKLSIESRLARAEASI